MVFKNFTANENDDNRRLDRIICKLLSNTSRTIIFKNIRTGFIKVNLKKTTPNQIIQKGDIINIAEILINSDTNTTEKNKDVKLDYPKLDILFKNNNLLFINKPYDIAVQASKKDEISLDKIIQNQYIKDSLSFVPGPLHRLDKRTTGILVFSQSLLGAKTFSDCIQKHNIEKNYLTILEGNISKEMEFIDYSIEDENDTTNFHKMRIANESEKNAKINITQVSPIKSLTIDQKDYTYCKCSIKTGRTHQIRLQCSYHGHPLAGDIAYSGSTTSFFTKFFLHAYELIFSNEISDLLSIPNKITAALPIDFADLIKKI